VIASVHHALGVIRSPTAVESGTTPSASALTASPWSWPSSWPSTRSGTWMGRRARSWHKVLSSQHGGAGGAVFKVSRGSPAPLLQARGAIEARRKRSHWRDPEVPRTDPLL